MNYEELVKALRFETDYVDVEKTMLDAAAAIEALDRLLDQNTQRCEALRKQLREAHESYEKHLNELEAQLPKRGEMYFLEYDNPETGEYEQTYFQCSVCGKYFYALDECEVKHFNYCPNCGAKMREVQE